MDNIFKDCFPHDEIRPQQEHILNMISENMDKRYIILECPTGIGKSAIAKTLANYFNSSYILTLTKQLQDQYMEQYNDGDMVSIKGKANYKCDLNPAFNCESAICNYNIEQKIDCLALESCSYYKLRRQAMNSKILVTSYQYMLRAFDCAGIWDPRELMVFDECHDIEAQIINWGKVELSIPTLIEENILHPLDANECRKLLKFNKIDDYIEYIFDIIRDKRRSKLDKIDSLYDGKTYNELSLSTQSEISQTYNEYKVLDFYFRRIDVYRTTISKENENNEVHSCYYVKYIKDKENVLITPLKIGNLFNYYLNKNILDKALFMSSSILDENEFINQLRIKKDKCLVIKMDSYFDYKKSPIINCNIAKTNYQSLNDSLPILASTMDAIIDKHCNEKGIVHTSNYKIAKYLYEHSKYKDKLLMIDNDNSNNESLINKHLQSDNSILLSPSLTTGVDLYDDQSRFQIIVKLPWLSMADELIKKKLETSRRFYVINMLRTFLQSCGRSIRNVNDWCVTYVLDSSLEYYMKRYKKYFYNQFNNRFIWDKSKFNLKEFKDYINEAS